MMTEHDIKVVLAEDHRVTRLGLRMFLEEHKIEVIGEAVNGQEAVTMTASLKPDIVLMDVEMPVMDGIEAARLIRKDHPDVGLVMVTSHDRECEIFASLAAGANGYCLKDVSDDRLYTAIVSVYDGDFWLDSAIAQKVVKALPSQEKAAGDPSQVSGAVAPLSPREVDVLKLIVEGKNNHAIADELVITGDTVKSHIKHIMEKLSVTDRTQAAVKAIRQGLV